MRIVEFIEPVPRNKMPQIHVDDTKAAAEKHEREVQYFKHMGEDNKLLDKPTLSVAELADKHDVDINTIRSQLIKGIKVELEHTSDPKIAKEIALDHIAEKPDYYDRLATVEQDD